ncbi:MAG: hypothetical protein FWH18_06270 [Marinilabiliaceae bacterium]|nr:hypothetical protein [Marinilabiliaceae bacterium]
MKNLKKIKMLSIILLICGGCIIGGCKNPDKNVDNEEIQLKVYSTTNEGIFYLNENEFVRFYYSPESGYFNEPIEKILENNTKRILSFGTEYIFEYFENENWIEIPCDCAFSSVEIILGAGETLKSPLGSLAIDKEGRYRYGKKFGLSSELSNFSDYVGFTLYAELEVKIKK